MYTKLISPKLLIFAPLLLLLVLAAACGDDETPTPQVIEREIVKEVEVPVEVEKEVIKEVEVEVTKEVVKQVEVEVEVTKEVVKEVEKEVVKEVEVEKEVVVTVVATPTPAAMMVEAKVDVLEVMLDPVFFDTNLPWMAHGSETNNQIRHMSDPVVEMDPFTGEMVPGLATSWEMTTPDAKTWVFNLRKGVQFHDGWGEATAKDVVHTLKLMTSEESIDTGSRRWRDIIGTTQTTTAESNDIISEVPDNVDIIDDYTIQLNLLNTWFAVPFEFSARGGSTFPMSKNFWESEGRAGYEDHFVGTGSWQWRERVLGQYLWLDRVEEHWEIVPDFKSLKLNWSREPATRLAALLTGEAHIVTLPRSLYSQAQTEGMVIFTSSIPANEVVIGFGGLYLPTSEYYKPDVPFLNKKVRQAINHAINRDEINEEIFGGAGVPLIVQGFHPSQEGWNPEWEKNFERDYGYDPDRAKELIAEAGFAPGEIKIQSLITELAQLPEMGELGEVMSIYLDPIGIEVEDLELEFSAFVPLFREGKLHGILSNLPRTITHPIGALRTFNLSLPDGSVAYSETEFIEENYWKFRSSTDVAERAELILAMGQHKYDEYVEVPMFWLLGEVVADPDIVADHHFSGGIAGTYTHWEYVEAVPK